MNIGQTNPPDQTGIPELFRAIFRDITEFDLDVRFTPKQREIILKALKGLAEHKALGEKMAALVEKGAEVNIVADFTGLHTGSDHARTYDLNEDRTVDRGESITIYINMNYGGVPTTDRAFASTIVRELIHTFGDPALNALLDAPNSTWDRGPTRDIFSGYDFEAPARSQTSAADVISVPAGGGALAGGGDYAVYGGSDAADQIAAGAGGGLVYSGLGDDRITVGSGGVLVELVDDGGSDTVALPTDVTLSDVEARWTSDGSSLAMLVRGEPTLLVLGAEGARAVETIEIGGIAYALSALAPSTNHAPVANIYDSVVEGSFFGGYVGDASWSDADGDRLSYKLETVAGEHAESMWRVDPTTGAVLADFTRMQQDGSSYSFVTISASDGIEERTTTLTIRWGNRNELPTPIETQPWFEQTGDDPIDGRLYLEPVAIAPDTGGFHV